MLRAIIIDDEENALDLLKIRIENNCKEIEIVTTCLGSESGIKAIMKLNPDLIFLDIEMPGKNGFDVLNETKEFDYNVIFVTAFDHFAIKAIKYSALDYLLKPIDIDELKTAVAKAVQQRPTKLDSKTKIETLLTSLQSTSVFNKIALPFNNGIKFCSPDEIIRCESDSNYSSIFLTNGKKIVLSKTLKDVEETLANLTFIRIHQSHLVNLNHIVAYSKTEGNLTMSDGKLLNVSRNRKEDFLNLFRKL